MSDPVFFVLSCFAATEENTIFYCSAVSYLSSWRMRKRAAIKGAASAFLLALVELGISLIRLLEKEAKASALLLCGSSE